MARAFPEREDQLASEEIVRVMWPPALCGRETAKGLIHGERAVFGHITLQ